MDADSTPPLKIRLPTSLPGSSVPIRAPLTIDSDSEFCLSINDRICSRTSSFNSSSSSIDVSSYGDDEHVSVLEEEEDDGFVAYPDEEMVIESCRVEEHSFTRPFVKYPDENYVKKGSDFDKSAIFRSSVKIPLMPVAPLTIDCDSDNDSVESRRSLSSGGIPADGCVQKIAMAPKVRVFCSYEGDDELQFDDDIHESKEPIEGSVSAKMLEEDEDKIECLNEVLKISEMDEIELLCLDEQKKGDEDYISFDSDNEIKIEIETINGSEHEGVFDCYRNESEITSEKEEDQRKEDEDEDYISFDSQRIDAQIVSDSDNETETETINEIEQDLFDCYINESKKTSKKEEDEDDISFDSQRIDAQIVSHSDNEIEIETINEIEQDLYDCYINESKKTSKKEEDEDDISFDSQIIDTQIFPDSDKEIKIETINGIKQEDVFDHFSEPQKTLCKNEKEIPVKMQPIQAKFLGKPPVMEANGEHSSDEFDFSLTILVIGKTGVGKSATINSIFREKKALTDAFRTGTTTVKEIVGKINGIRVKIFDTPGLRDSPSELSYNRKILTAVKRFIQKRTPDIVLYVDRLDMRSKDSHVLRLITSSLGSSVWRNCIIVLTHANSLHDERLGGFVIQRCRFIQQQIVHFRATGQQTVNPVWLIENQKNPSYKHDESWQTRFLLLCYSAKILLHEASSVVEPSLSSLERNWFEFSDGLGHVIDLDAGSEGLKGSVLVQPVQPLGKPRNGGRLIGEHKKVYFEDYDYRLKVFGMKIWSLVFRLHF